MALTVEVPISSQSREIVDAKRMRSAEFSMPSKTSLVTFNLIEKYAWASTTGPDIVIHALFRYSSIVGV